MAPDRIEKAVRLNAPLTRVWAAIADATQFGRWFGMALDGPFAAGTAVTGRIAPTAVDAAVARLQEPFAGRPVTLQIEQIKPMRLFSFRWHPYAVEPDFDASEPTTLVEFTLEEREGTTVLTIVESGFDRIPLARRARAFAANDAGWGMQTQLLEKYLFRHSTC